MPVRMKPEPLEQPRLPLNPYGQLENVHVGQHRVQPVRPPGGQLYLPHQVNNASQLSNYHQGIRNPGIRPQQRRPYQQHIRIPNPQALQSAQQQQQQQQQQPQPQPRHQSPLQTVVPEKVAEPNEDEKNEDENIGDRIDVDSIKGIFGWATIDNVNVPYIVRKHKKFVAVRIVEKKLLSRYPNSFPDELSKKEPLVSYFVTENEAKLLDEINQVHCSFEYGQQAFSCKDLIVDMVEFEDFYNIVKKTFPDDFLAKLRGEATYQSPPPRPTPPQSGSSVTDSVNSALSQVCGWVQINNTVSPYIKRFNGQFVPLSVIRYAAGLLTDCEIEGTLPTIAECNLLNGTCKAAGFDFSFGQNTKVIPLSEVTQRCDVNIIELPFDDPLQHAQYLDPEPSPPHQQSPPAVSRSPSQPQRTAAGMQIPNVNPFSAGYPPSIPPNPYFNMMPVGPPRYPGMGQYPMASLQGGRYPYMSPPNMPTSRMDMSPQSRYTNPTATSCGNPVQNRSPSNPLTMMSQMAHNGNRFPIHPAFPTQMPQGSMGGMNQMMHSAQTSPSSQRGPSQQGLPNRGQIYEPRRNRQAIGQPKANQSMHMKLPFQSNMNQPRGPMLHTAQQPQLSPTQSSITRCQNPLSEGSVDKPIGNKPSPIGPSSSPLTSVSTTAEAVTNKAKTMSIPASMSLVNGVSVQNEPRNKTQPSGQTDKSSAVDKIHGVVLHGKSISCMHLDTSGDRNGKYCLVEAVCKLYFSHSCMSEFLYALQHVLKIPLQACSGEEEKAFIQYYNLPVNVLKCNKMISLPDLDKFFPQMSYMFNQNDTPPTDGNSYRGANADKSSSSSGQPAGGASESRKRASVGNSPTGPTVKQPCRRLEEMVQKLKQQSNVTTENSDLGNSDVYL